MELWIEDDVFVMYLQCCTVNRQITDRRLSDTDIHNVTKDSLKGSSASFFIVGDWISKIFCSCMSVHNELGSRLLKSAFILKNNEKLLQDRRLKIFEGVQTVTIAEDGAGT